MRHKTEDGRYCCFYPQERPRDGSAIDVWAENGGYLGVGIGSTRRSCGGVIVVNGKTYDSNHVVHWLPLEVKP